MKKYPLNLSPKKKWKQYIHKHKQEQKQYKLERQVYIRT